MNLTKTPIFPWHEQSWQHLQCYVQQDRIPQALLITGNKGLGKQALADQYTHALLCHSSQNNDNACGQCQSCLLAIAGTHPDILHIQPEEPGKNISIAQIRSLTSKLSLKPQYDRYRVAIINPADALNNAAANAFLKYLEEPTERTCLILITDKPSRLPATIISRCQKLPIKPPNQTTLINWLTQHAIHKNVELLCNLSKNAPLLAQQYAADQHIDTRNQCFTQWTAIAKKQTHPVLVAEQWLAIPDATLLFWLSTWIIDIIKCTYQVRSSYLHNPDLTKPLQELARQLELTGLYTLYDLLLQCQQRLHTQINKQLMLEEILIHWSTLTQRANYG